MAPPSIIQPGLRAVAAQRVRAEASESERREPERKQIGGVVVARNRRRSSLHRIGGKDRSFLKGLSKTSPCLRKGLSHKARSLYAEFLE